MSALEELQYYCEKENSFGALMLTGQWGCGKTFLIENDLTSSLGDQFVVIRISLFGIASIEEVNQKIKKLFFEKVMLHADAYFDTEDGEAHGMEKQVAQGVGKAAKVVNGHKGFAVIRDLAKLIPGAEKFLSIEPSNYINVENHIGTKPVILVFDDLERNTLKETEILGCINEYCENKQFKTIIVANEEKIDASSETTPLDGAKEGSDIDATEKKIAYKQIKEKIVSRTIKCTPDYTKIIDQILVNFTGEDVYKTFLLHQVDRIIGVFLAGKSKNIRSLKCALQDFQRVYILLVNAGITEHLEKYLSSFMGYILCFKEGNIKKSDIYGYLLLDSSIEKAYPLYYSNGYMLDSVKFWIIEGEWVQESVEAEIAQLIARKAAPSATDLVSSYQLLSLDEATIQEGFTSVLEAGYAGRLSTDQYILLLENISWARSISFQLPAEVDANRLNAGVCNCLRLIEESDEPARFHGMLSKEKEALLSKEEVKIYYLIWDFREKSKQMFAINRRKYLSALDRPDMSGLYECENKRFNLFDGSMANAATAFFTQLANFDRQCFINLFRNVWEGHCSSPDLQKEESLQGFAQLRDNLDRQRTDELENGLQLKAALSEMFIQTTQVIIDRASASLAREREAASNQEENF